MLSLPDFKQKQIIFIQSWQTKNIRFKNNNLVVEEDGKIKTQVPCPKIFAIFIIGNFSFSSVLVQKMQSHGIGLFFLNINFRFYAALGVQTEGNTILRKRQYSNENDLEIAKKIIFNKTDNQIRLLKKIRQKSKKEKDAIQQLKKIQTQIESVERNDSLLGLEGSAAKVFFSVYFQDFKWSGRKPRTKYDVTNTLLDMGYTTLFNFIESLLRMYGFDIYCGVYHQFFYERKSLVCDLVEPFRCIVDETVRKAYKLGQIDEKDFYIQGHQYLLKRDKTGKYSRLFLEAIMNHKEPLFCYIQKYYRTFVRGEISNFPSFQIHIS